MRGMNLSHYALAVAMLFAAIPVFAATAPLPEEIIEPAPAPIYPLAIVCVEQPGTSEARPCEPWCDRRLVSHVLRFMIVERRDGSVRFEWRESGCEAYLAERIPV